MGYSARTDAFNSLEWIMAARLDQMSNNAWLDDHGMNCFYEIGRENTDGAITGTCHKCADERIVAHASFRIEPNGKVTRFPYANKLMRLAFTK
ncbi:MAG TPA: hypothetical protein VMV86_00295 [Methanosarcinales archaeon]|nr:hypothetical protein [Methanosarcinales archaeon]